MAHIIFYIIIAIILFDYFFEKLLDYLNYTRLNETVPSELGGIYDKARYQKSQQYQKENLRFSLITSTFSLIVLLIVLFGGGFGFLDGWVRSVTENDYIRTLLFFGILGMAFDFVSIPFQIYDTFIIEEKYGFNKTKPVTFIVDKLKSWMLSLIIGGGLLLFIQWAWSSTGYWFWIIVMGGISLFIIFIAVFYTHLIVPLFNKLTPLEEGELKAAILAFTDKAGFKLDNVYVIDGSKRSTKANAYFSGFGPKKRVVLYDTLMNELDKEEIVAVLAHEIGHYKKKHIQKGLAVSLIQSAVMLWLLWLALDTPVLSLALGAEQPGFYMGLLAFGLLFSPVSFVTGILSNILSRKFEFQADAFAKEYHLGQQLIDALIRLSVKNLSNLTPHPVYVFFHYSHPPLLQRKKALESSSL